MTELGLLLSDMAVCVACRDVVDDTVETPEGTMCRRCAEEHESDALTDEDGVDGPWERRMGMYLGDEEVER